MSAPASHVEAAAAVPSVAGPADLPARMVALWARHDAEAFGELFTVDGTMILPGVLCRGRDEIRNFMADSFSGKYRGTRVTGAPIAVTPLGPDCVLLLTEGGVLHGDELAVSAQEAIRASWLSVRDGGTWRLAAYQNSPRD